MVDFAKNNPTDIDSYKAFMRKQQLLAKKTQEKTNQIRIAKNLEVWEQKLDYPWNKADASFFTGRPLELLNEAIDARRLQSFVIMSTQQGGKTFFTYALIKEYIKAGLVTPSQIRITDVRQGITSINGMFKAREWKEDFFSKDAKLLVVEGCSAEFSNLRLKDQDQFWAEVVEHCNEHKKILIITYTLDENELKEDIILPKITLDSKFNYRAFNSTKFIKIDESTRNTKKPIIK